MTCRPPTGGYDAAMTHDLAFIGAGNMAEAIARGVLASGLFEAGRIVAVDPSAERRAVFADGLGIAARETVGDATAGAATVMICVKPQQMDDLLPGLQQSADASTLFVSIAAGVTTGRIESGLGGYRRVVRAMPNTPMLVGLGAVAICPGTRATADDLSTARTIFETGAAVVEVDEAKMNAVTAVSGSGPAYVFWLAEQMTAAGVDLGLSPHEAATLAVRTVAGAGKMLADLPDAPADLRRRVTSPGGTTQAALEHLASSGADRNVRDAVAAACRRGRELGG